MPKLSTYYRNMRMNVVEFIPQKYSKVLEVGCGQGSFRINFANDCEYWGVEPYIDSAEIANKKLTKVLVGTFDEVFNDLPDNYFDLVVCNDVIEHMIDHHTFYSQIKVKCTKDAYMIGSIPNVRYIRNLYKMLIKKDWEYTEEGILDKTHLRFFTLNSIKRDFLNNRFYIEQLYGINEIIFRGKTFSAFKMILFKVLFVIFGQDTKFLQFGFRVRLR